MDLLDALKKIVNEEVVIEIATVDENYKSGNGKLTIREDAARSRLDKLTISGIPACSFAFTLDYQPKDGRDNLFKQLSCYVHPGNREGANKGCDLVLFVFENDQWKVFILDLKSDKPKESDAEKQLLNSELYVRYLLSMVQHYYEFDKGIDDFKYQQIIITTSKGRKGPTYSPSSPSRYKYEEKKKRSFRIREATVKGKEGTIMFGKLA